MWGQHGPDKTLNRSKSGPLRFLEATRDLLADDDQIVINCESYGQAWASGDNDDQRTRHVLEYVDAMADDLGVYTYCSDWDYRGSYATRPANVATHYENAAPNVAYGADAWANAALERGNIGLLAWSLTPHDQPGEMRLAASPPDAWATDIDPSVAGSNLTYAGQRLYEVATTTRPTYLDGTTPPPPTPPPAHQFEGTVRLTYTAPPPPKIPATSLRTIPDRFLEAGDAAIRLEGDEDRRRRRLARQDAYARAHNITIVDD